MDRAGEIKDDGKGDLKGLRELEKNKGEIRARTCQQGKNK